MSGNNSVVDSPLGKAIEGVETYAPELLFAVPRSQSRESLFGAEENLPFYGADYWNLWEVSWLNETGKPEVRVGQLIVPCESSNLVESKSLKLYLNSLNFTQFPTEEDFIRCVEADVSKLVGSQVTLSLLPVDSPESKVQRVHGVCLDELSMAGESVLAQQGSTVEETLYSHLFRSRCPVTGQPDWATVVISYEGLSVNKEALLAYLVGFRRHQGFHEACVEQIFMDLQLACEFESLVVIAYYTRRGGIDINPYRATCAELPDTLGRLGRQ